MSTTNNKNNLIFIMAFMILTITGVQATSEETSEETEPALAVIFPWFIQIIGVVVFFLITRFFPRLPFTAVMFILGVFIGIGAHHTNLTDQLTESVHMWSSIDSEVLLLVFLPGLIFRDAYSLNVHLFMASLSQSLIFAFPMVLAGTVLTALVAFYIFPYGWSFYLAMTFGSILSATDPVAVAALLEEVGAPPRLKTHIAAESLLNDGSAVVFYTIFSGLFFLELGVDGLGQEVNLPTGIELFCRMSIGGACIGVAFGIGLIQILRLCKRRLNQEENVVEVAATITIAYLCYYTADVAWHTSGVIATLMCGVTTKAFGANLINDVALMDNFWVLVEHLLNTLIFGLGGTVWGFVIVHPDSHFAGEDWGYLIVLYLLLTVIRYGMFFIMYPITACIGLGTSWQETFFTCYGGLRGAVGIALAIALDNTVVSNTEPDSEYRAFTTKVFGFVGGIALLTLVINGITAGPVLRALGLAEETSMRKRIIENYNHHFRKEMLAEMVRLLTQKRFRHVDFAIVRQHVKSLENLTREELDEAIEHHRQTIPSDTYIPPHTNRIYPYLDNSKQQTNKEVQDEEQPMRKSDLSTDIIQTVMEQDKDKDKDNDEEVPIPVLGRSTTATEESGRDIEFGDTSAKTGNPSLPTIREFRLIFIALVRASYHQQIQSGEMSENEGFLSYILLQSLDFATDEVNAGGKFEDWKFTQVVPSSIRSKAKSIMGAIKKTSRCFGPSVGGNHSAERFKIHRALAFLRAHMWAQQRFVAEFQKDFPAVDEIIIQESNAQIKLAESVLVKRNRGEVERFVSQIFCGVLLNDAAKFIERMNTFGFIKEQEAEEYLHDIQHELHGVQNCDHDFHYPGMMERPSDSGFFTSGELF